MEVDTAPPAYRNDKITEGKDELAIAFEEQGQLKAGEVHDAFGNEDFDIVCIRFMSEAKVKSGVTAYDTKQTFCSHSPGDCLLFIERGEREERWGD